MRDLGRRAPLVVWAVAAALTCGCSGDPEPSTLPDITPTSTPASTGTPALSSTPSADPTAALEAELEAFFSDYVRLASESWTSKEALATKARMYSETCTSCTYITQQAERAQREGFEYVGGAILIDDLQVVSSDAPDASVLVTTSSDPAVLSDSAGEPVETFYATNGLQTVYQLRKVDGAWVIISDQVL